MARSSSEEHPTKTHLRPVWITSALLLLTLVVTFVSVHKVDAPGFLPGNILVLTLLELNLILLVLLVLLLSRNLIKHYFERRQRIPGSGFRGKLIYAFAGFAAIPAILLLIVASGLLTSSVENWFSIQVEHPLDNAINVAQLYYQKEEETARNFSSALGGLLAGQNIGSAGRTRLVNMLAAKRREYGVAGVELYTRKKSEPLRSLDPDLLPADLLPPAQELFEKSYSGQTVVEKPSTDAGNLIRAISPVRASPRGPVEGVVLVDILIPRKLERNMQGISRSFEEYKQLKAFKNPIKESYLLSFVLITVVILFSATWFGFYLAKGITVPLQQLAEGTRAVAQGDLSFRIRVKASDELGVLVDSFNKMTEDLQGGKNQLEDVNRSLVRTNVELDQRRVYIETVLQNITTGLISLDPHGRITAINHAANRIFQTENQQIQGKLIRDAFQSLKLTPLLELIEDIDDHGLRFVDREVQVEIEGRMLILRIHLTRIQNEEGNDLGKVMVVEDLTELIKAEKSAAWKEVAQRIAHEIKNPLTPIQLSAERLHKKFLEQSSDFPGVLEESTRIIMNEVRSLKHLVDEFSLFARLPAPRFARENIHDIAQEVIQLYSAAHRDIEIITDYDTSIPSLNLDREQIRRVFVNLFENAVEAMNHRGHLWVVSRHDPVNRKAVLKVEDDGPGTLPEDQDKLFLPYFSRKKTGTGLGLAIVHRIVKEHNGNIGIANRNPHGTQITIELPA
jgi:two-component system nitrogen regulation sensor histidine kinase NtrY